MPPALQSVRPDPDRNLEKPLLAQLIFKALTTLQIVNDLGLAANHPALRPRCREISNGERAAVGPDDILDPRAVGFGHVTLTHRTQKARD